MTSTSEYNRKYYKDNKRKIRKYKRNLYLTNKLYRDNIKESAFFAKRFKTLREIGGIVEVAFIYPNYQEFTYSLKQMESMIPRCYSSLRYLVNNNCIPNPTIKKKRYTESQVKLIGHVLVNYSGMEYKDVKRLLKEFWKDKFNKRRVDKHAKKSYRYTGKRKGNKKHKRA